MYLVSLFFLINVDNIYRSSHSLTNKNGVLTLLLFGELLSKEKEERPQWSRSLIAESEFIMLPWSRQLATIFGFGWVFSS